MSEHAERIAGYLAKYKTLVNMHQEVIHQIGLGPDATKLLVPDLESLVAENQRLRKLAKRAIVANHMRHHASLDNPNFGECQDGFCSDWHALTTESEGAE